MMNFDQPGNETICNFMKNDSLRFRLFNTGGKGGWRSLSLTPEEAPTSSNHFQPSQLDFQGIGGSTETL